PKRIIRRRSGRWVCTSQSHKKLPEKSFERTRRVCKEHSLGSQDRSRRQTASGLVSGRPFQYEGGLYHSRRYCLKIGNEKKLLKEIVEYKMTKHARIHL